MEEQGHINKIIGSAMKEGLHRKNITQTELADMVGSTQRSISSYVTGNTQPPLDILAQIAVILEINVNQVLGIPEFRHPYIIVKEKDEKDYMQFLDGLDGEEKEQFIELVSRIRELIK